jgi:acylphosphatase
VLGTVRGTGLPSALVAEADRLGCFGWVQNTAQGSLVGEARCNNINGPKLAEWLQSGSTRPQLATVDKVLLKVYEDTKIKLHFSQFKILPDDRKTCFR